MIQKRLHRLIFFTISIYIFLILTFHNRISKLSMPFGKNMNQKNVHKKNVNISKRETESFGNDSTIAILNKSTIIRSFSKSLQSVTIQSTKSYINFTLPKFNETRPIVFLHIGKNGGTSFDRTVGPIIKKLRGKYIGSIHFDWSRIETIPNADVVVLLREPVSRAVSHYFFTRKWSKNKLNTGPLETYLHNPKEMLETRDCWQDGQASVAWLTGTHVANWVGIKKEKVPERERMSLNISEMCLLAARRLESTFWFGILEDQERSLELLQHQLGLSQKINFPKANMNKHTEASRNETEILASLMPQDIWLYEYAKLLFEARWTYYKTGVYMHPDMPPIPTLENVPCISTRFILLCKKGPLSPLFHVNRNSSLQDQRLPENILDKFVIDENFFIHINLTIS